MPNISLRGVNKNYGNNTASAVESLDLEVADGEFMCLLGPSGCGKTTTLRMIAGLEHPTAGEVQVGEKIFDSVSRGIYVPPEKRGMGLVFQSYALWPHLTVEKNVDFGLRLKKLDKEERQTRTNDVMKALGIEQFSDRYPSQLSGGQQQRVALARMLAMNPSVLLLDEPLSNLDARLRLEMRAELKRIHEEFNTTIVFVTHDQWEAMTLATTIAVMSAGVLQQFGTPDDIYARPANRFVAEFVGSPPINIIELALESSTGLGVVALSYLDRSGFRVPNLGSVGIRPESIHIAVSQEDAPAHSLRGLARVNAVVPTGGSWILELVVGDEKLFTTTSIPPEVHRGDDVTFWVSSHGLHFFDAQGQRVVEADSLASAS